MITQVLLLPDEEEGKQHSQRKHHIDPLYSKNSVDLKPLAEYIASYIHSKMAMPRFKELCDYDMHDLRDHIEIHNYHSG